jgi:hypothetical protein
MRLPVQQQEIAAELLEQLTVGGQPVYPLSDEERAAVKEALSRASRGEFASGEEIQGALLRPWK